MIRYWALHAGDAFEKAFCLTDKEDWERLYRHNAEYDTWVEGDEEGGCIDDNSCL